MSKKVCAVESLHLAHWWAETRAAWLHHNNRRTEALAAEEEAVHYALRISHELGVEVG